MTAEIIQGPWRTKAISSAEALDALRDIIDRARQAGGVSSGDNAAFAIYALAVLGPGWELRHSG